MKKVLILILALSFSLAGCGSKEETTQASEVSLEEAEAMVYRHHDDMTDQEFEGMHYQMPASWSVDRGDGYVSYFGDHNIYIRVTKETISATEETYVTADYYLQGLEGCTSKLMGFQGLYDGFEIEGSIMIENEDRYYLGYYVRSAPTTLYIIQGSCDKDAPQFLSMFMVDFEATMSFD